MAAPPPTVTIYNLASCRLLNTVVLAMFKPWQFITFSHFLQPPFLFFYSLILFYMTHWSPLEPACVQCVWRGWSGAYSFGDPEVELREASITFLVIPSVQALHLPSDLWGTSPSPSPPLLWHSTLWSVGLVDSLFAPGTLVNLSTSLYIQIVTAFH